MAKRKLCAGLSMPARRPEIPAVKYAPVLTCARGVLLRDFGRQPRGELFAKGLQICPWMRHRREAEAAKGVHDRLIRLDLIQK